MSDSRRTGNYEKKYRRTLDTPDGSLLWNGGGVTSGLEEYVIGMT
jgi:hypothetical protein